MKKLFFFIPALVLSLVVNATRTEISPTTPYASDAVRLALNYSSEGDTIVLTSGTYVESKSDYIAWKRSNVVMAAEGATVTIKPHVSFRVRNGARAELIGVKIDAGELTSEGSYEDIFQAGDANDGNRLIIENCEIYGNVAKTMLRCASDKKLDSLIINNCYIHDNAQATLRLQSTSLKGVIITNTTIANVANGGSFWCAPIDISSTAPEAKVIVDHCTFYHNTSISSSYADVTVGYDGSATSDVTITNCIFAQPASYDGSRAINLVNGGIVRNCLTFNYTKSTNGIQGATVTENCIFADPIFTDAASGDFSYPGNWITMDLSPARGAATDGSDLGDPRWYTAETLPSTNFASAYDLLGTKALLAGNIELNASDHIKYKDSQVAGTAKWKLHITKECAISAVADRESGSTSGCTLTLTVYDTDGNEVDATTAARSDNDNDINIGILYIPEEGDYTIVLSNSVEYSDAILEKITLSYVGGAVQNIASATNTTVGVSEAWYSAGGSRADAKISFPDDLIATSWIRWNVHVAESKYYDITVNFESDNGHNLGVRLFNDDRNIEISEGGQTSAASPIELGRLSIPAGDYTMEVTNPISHSHAQLISVLFAPVAASATALPGTLEFGNAVLSDRAHITDGNLYFAPIGDTNPAGEWASWAVTTDHNGTFLFTMGVNSNNGQSYKISIYDDTDNLIDAFEKKISSNTAATIKHYFNLTAGNYSVKVENTTAWSHGYLTSLIVTEPSILSIDETATTNSVINDNYRLDAQDIQIIRTITAGMYNTICLPFDVTDADLKSTFGSDVELLQMASATIDGTVLDLNFENVTTGIYRGTPYLIKTSRDIVNPIFVDAIIKEKVGQATSGTAANFIGTFIATTIPEDPNNLFLGANDKLYFPEGGDMPIKGMRAYFAVTGSSGAPVRQARIVAQGNVVTKVELVNGQLPSEFGGSNLRKSVENGQLIIIRDGAQYNALGVRVK
ncbi:MAG: DUF5123 domain-containing protein [Paludibacteraceae bacterium]|nr:DUF5123 domain-containing protein [Paludibacteraceae bacterium]